MAFNLKPVVVLLCVCLHLSHEELYSCAGNYFSTSAENNIRELAQYSFVLRQLENIIGTNDVCSYFKSDKNPLSVTVSPSYNHVDTGVPSINHPPSHMHGPDSSRQVVKCDSCKNCEDLMPLLQENLTNSFQRKQLIYFIVPKSFDVSRYSANNIKFVTEESHTQEKIVRDVCEVAETEGSDALRSFSKTSVLFVSISFIILMVISLAWLVFYYVQRFRYAHAKDRMQRRLFNAAKKALTRIPTKPVKAGDKELDADCPVCIDPYRAGDIVRMLPCRHVFHKTCVDPWLLEHRTCPMCKSDILKAFGYQVNMNNGRRRAQFSGQVDDHGGIHVESDRLSSNSTASESNAYPYPVVSEIHDPFSFTPSTSPQLMQVMNEMNARAFSIIPLTVHSGPSPHFPNNPSTSNSTTNNHRPSVDQPTTSNRIIRSAAGSSTNRKVRGHVVNLVHVRSRSLSQTQMPNGSHDSNSDDSKNENQYERRPSALFRTGVQNADTVTIEIPPSEQTQDDAENIPNTEPESTVGAQPNLAFVRMAISQENVAANKSTMPRPITRGHSVKTIGTRQQPNKNFCRRVPGQPQIASFPMLPTVDIRPVTAVVSDVNSQNPRTVPISSTLSIESL